MNWYHFNAPGRAYARSFKIGAASEAEATRRALADYPNAVRVPDRDIINGKRRDDQDRD